MKKTIAAVTAGLLLIAGQATAANTTADARVGDRIGASTAESSEFAGVPMAVLVVGAALLIATIVVATDEDDEPQSD